MKVRLLRKIENIPFKITFLHSKQSIMKDGYINTNTNVKLKLRFFHAVAFYTLITMTN